MNKMNKMLDDLSSQSYIVIEQLMSRHKINRKKATDIWFNSKTKKELEMRGLFLYLG